MSQKIPMTPEGYERLRAELEHLKRVERPKVVRAIAEAREHGDLSENAEYHAAKERQSFVEGRILELQNKLAQAQVIQPKSGDPQTVVFGSTVHLVDLESGEEKRYTLVGAEESDIANGRISVHSPVGRALIGHRVGDVVTIQAPARTIEYEIQAITFD